MAHTSVKLLINDEHRRSFKNTEEAQDWVNSYSPENYPLVKYLFRNNELYQIDMNTRWIVKTENTYDEVYCLRDVYTKVFEILQNNCLENITVTQPDGTEHHEVYPSMYLEGSHNYVRLFPLNFHNPAKQSLWWDIARQYEYPLVHIPIDMENGTSACVTVVDIHADPAHAEQISLQVEVVKPSFRYNVEILLEGEEKLIEAKYRNRQNARAFAKRGVERCEKENVGYAIELVIYDEHTPLLAERWDFEQQKWVIVDPNVESTE